MRKELREEKKVREVFIADDGREFSDEQSCLMYEFEKEEERIAEAADRMPHFECNPPFTDVDITYRWNYCSTWDDLQAVFIRYLCSDERRNYTEDWLKKIPLPGWVVTASDECGYGYINGAKDDLDLFEGFVRRMRENISRTPVWKEEEACWSLSGSC